MKTPNERFSKLIELGSRHDRIIALFNGSRDDGTNDLENRAYVSLLSHEEYEEAILEAGSLVSKVAGTALSNILYPFQAKPNNDGMPKFHGSATTESTLDLGYPSLYDLLPFRWDTNGSTTFKHSSSYEHIGYGTVLSGSGIGENTNFFINESNIRGIGLRLPLMGVGWGYTTDGMPWPSGSSEELFKGDVDNGFLIDPSEYIVAPIDFRYDQDRNVWIAGEQAQMFKVQNVHDNYLICKRWDGSVLGTNIINVAKYPEVQRQEYENFIVADPVDDSIEWSFEYTGTQTRTVTKNGTDTQDQVITPRYLLPSGDVFLGSTVLAVPLLNVVLEDSSEIEINCGWIEVTNRAFAKAV